MLLRTPVLEACQHRASSRRVGRRLAPRPRARVARAKRSRAAGPSTSATHILVSFDALLPETFWTLRRGQFDVRGEVDGPKGEELLLELGELLREVGLALAEQLGRLDGLGRRHLSARVSDSRAKVERRRSRRALGAESTVLEGAAAA